MKRVLPLLLLAAVVLTACGGQSTATKWASTSTKVAATSTKAGGATATPVPPTAAPTPTVTPLPNGCQTVSLLPEPDPAFPAASKSDWVKGPETAKVTILEFSDFQ